MDIQHEFMEWIDRQSWLDSAGKSIQQVVSDLYSSGGQVGLNIRDFLHGVWIGHPLHSVLTDIPLGAYTVGAVLETLEMVTGDEGYGKSADASVLMGVAGAVGSALSGVTDWQHTTGSSRRVGLLHGALNTGALALYAASLLSRAGRDRRAGWSLALMGYALTLTAAYLGGNLVFDEKIGVNHAPEQDALPKKFTPVLAEADLPENQLRRVLVGEIPLLLVRRGGRIYALSETCAHLGGPLAEGTLKDNGPDGPSVVCPWHASSFALEDGRVLQGPSTFRQPCLEVRVRDGQIEVKASNN
ncbi:MAG TPA: Rieske (2Fe-2S) protein [Anaerolineales bacterium]